ncbi:MAG: hypothetical protein EPGJADBJ_01921 [Saprospiraceae bacterium]|nr:hypothetical protein [Saprospiraceae bacterium]
MNRIPTISPHALLAALCCLACCENPARETNAFMTITAGNEPKVRIHKTAGGFQLYRNGSPYFIKGAAGTEHLELLKAAGGNSFRTYTTDGLDSLLDRAEALGLTVMAGIWIGRAYEGFDYSDAVAVARQKEEVRNIVRRYKSHPALLCWAIGNEPNNGMERSDDLWPALHDLIDMVHEEDPDHPVTVPIYPFAATELADKCPNIDFISVNAFANIIAFANDYKLDKPFLFTELGIEGPWEAKTTPWYAVVENHMGRKCEKVEAHYQYVGREKARCLGSYVFYWGQKQEYTPTWFSFYTENGDKTALVDLMWRLWSNLQPANRAPLLEDLKVHGWDNSANLQLSAGSTCQASVKASDPDGDPLRFQWEILPDGPFFTYLPGRGKTEIRPRQLEELFIEENGGQIIFRAPANFGPFRLFVYAFDGQGNACSANLPFFVTNHSLTED